MVKEHVLNISPGEQLQVKERVSRRILPLFIAKDSERNRRISQMWRIPGTSVRISPEGDIYYPVWRERSRVNKPELYAPCSKLPRGWSLERLLASRRRPVSEVIFHQVRADEGAVEAAIRSMDHVMERYVDKGRELEQIEAVSGQINQAMTVLQETGGVSREGFEEGFEALYRQTEVLMERLGMKNATLALKRDIDRLLRQASTGKDATDRRNPMAALKRLQAAARRVEYRRNEAGFIVDKFSAMKEGLLAQRDKDRGILGRVGEELASHLIGHMYLKNPQQWTGRGDPLRQRGQLVGRSGTLVYQLEQVRVKAYKTVAIGATERLQQLQQELRDGNYEVARKLSDEINTGMSSVLDHFAKEGSQN